MSRTTKVLKNWKDMLATYENPHQLPPQHLRKILYAFNTLLVNSVIYDGQTYRLPHGVGTLTVLKRPTKKTEYFDYATFNKTGLRRGIKNFHSGGFKASLYGLTGAKTCALPTVAMELYKFKATRFANRELAKAIKDHNSINLYYDH